MSWDVMIFKFAGKQPENAEMIDEGDMIALGAAASVRESVSATIPTVDWTDPAWGVFDGDGFSIEFNVGKDDPIQNMMLHVRGGGDAVAAIMALAGPSGWSALDCSTGEFLNALNPSDAGWKQFQAYRDRVLGKREQAD